MPKVNPAISGGMPKMLKVGVFSFDVGRSMFDVGVFAYLDVHLRSFHVADFKEILGGLAEIVGQEFVKTEPDVLSDYGVDNMLPKAVVFPKDTEQVSEVVQLANRENMVIIPCGSRTRWPWAIRRHG